ncbi:MAG: zinc ribbon domain-containing protein [Clostridia bacterium]|nr:zinc ribbon domain-containing protein [Clostridia bacterium]
MYCYNCGKEIDNSAIACVYCGKPVVTENKTESNEKKESPVMWILGMVFAFIAPFIGLLLGIIGCSNYKDELLKRKSVSVMFVAGANFLSQAVVFVYAFAILMQFLKPAIDAAIAVA